MLAKVIKGLVIWGKITRVVMMGWMVVSVVVMVINMVQTFESIYLFFSTLGEAKRQAFFLQLLCHLKFIRLSTLSRSAVDLPHAKVAMAASQLVTSRRTN